MSILLEYSGELVIVRCWCGIQHAVPSSLRKEQLRHRDEGLSPISVYCPLGHKYVPIGESRSDRLKRQVVAARAQRDQLEAELATTEARRRAEKAAKTKLKKRIAAGVCPCCKRTFQNLARHMATQHPEEVDK